MNISLLGLSVSNTLEYIPKDQTEGLNSSSNVEQIDCIRQYNDVYREKCCLLWWILSTQLIKDTMRNEISTVWVKVLNFVFWNFMDSIMVDLQNCFLYEKKYRSIDKHFHHSHYGKHPQENQKKIIVNWFPIWISQQETNNILALTSRRWLTWLENQHKCSQGTPVKILLKFWNLN